MITNPRASGSGEEHRVRRVRRLALRGAIVVGVVLGALALAWRYTPLAQYATAAHVTRLAEAAAGTAWAPVAIVIAYPVASFVMFPRPLITLFAVVAFGPVLGFVYAMLGVFTSASATYVLGRAMSPRTLRRLVADKLDDVRAIIEKRGFVAMFAISIVPVAPFIVVGAAAGAMRVAYRSYIAGVLLGHVPGTLTTSIVGDQLKSALGRNASLNHTLIVAALVVFTCLVLAVRAWFARERRRMHDAAQPTTT